MQNATIIASPRVIVAMTWADLQGLSRQIAQNSDILLVSSPLNSEKEKRKATNRQEAAKVINTREGFSSCQTL
jgi:hypothetical protein